MTSENIVPSIADGIYLQAQWRALKGFAYGLRQPAMVGEVHVVIPADYDFTAMDQYMDALLEEPLTVPEGLANASERMVHRLLYWHAAVQRQQKIPVFGPHHFALIRAAQPENGHRFVVAVPYHLPEATISALNWVRGVLSAQVEDTAASPNDPAALSSSFQALLGTLQKYALGGTNMFHLLNAGSMLDIPSRLVFAGTYCFGVGARGHVLQSTLTGHTPALGVLIAHSKSKTALVLRQHGIPVPYHASASSEEQALEQANRIGYPVVIKPDDQEQGRGVEAGLRSDQAVSAAYQAAVQHSQKILVEKHHEGHDYRLTVFRGRVIKILQRRAGGVVGDGIHTIAELLYREQQTPRFQKRLRQTGKVLMELDDEALGILAERGLTPQSVPIDGEVIALRRKSNISAGGVQTLIHPEEAHPDNLDLAIRATRAVHLDLCGVDLIMPDISQSWLNTGAVIIEMNSQPQIGVEKAPEAYQVIIREVVNGDGRIPVNLVVCTTGADCPTLAQALGSARKWNCNAVSMANGVWINGRQLTAAAGNGFNAARIALADRSATGALCILTAADIVQHGLPADRFQRAVVIGHEKAASQEKAILQKALSMAKGNDSAMHSPVPSRQTAHDQGLTGKQHAGQF
jgi:cyanophycin synthetase